MTVNVTLGNLRRLIREVVAGSKEWRPSYDDLIDVANRYARTFGYDNVRIDRKCEDVTVLAGHDRYDMDVLQLTMDGHTAAFNKKHTWSFDRKVSLMDIEVAIARVQPFAYEIVNLEQARELMRSYADAFDLRVDARPHSELRVVDSDPRYTSDVPRLTYEIGRMVAYRDNTGAGSIVTVDEVNRAIVSKKPLYRVA